MNTKPIPLAFQTLFLSLMLPITATQVDGAPPAVRIVCASAMAENQELILAAADADGSWEKLATATVRSSQLGEWLDVKPGEIHVLVEEEGVPRSLGHFTLPEGTPRSLVLLSTDREAKTYDIRLVEPKKLGFEKGTTLIINTSLQTALVSLGEREEKLEAGSQVVTKAETEENGTYRMLVSFIDVAGDTVLAYDRQESADPNARGMIFLMSDDSLGVKVISLPIFGDLD